MKDIFIVDHPAGANYIKGMTIYGTQGTKDAIKNGAILAITQGLHKTFGDDFCGADIAQITKVLPAGKIDVGGIKFELIENGYSYDLAIPEINMIYTHMLGKNTHSIIANEVHMDAMLGVLKSYQTKGYELILSGHSSPEGQDAVAEKIKYVEKIKELAKASKTREDFITNVKKAFPNYNGDNYLEMTAGNLYNK